MGGKEKRKSERWRNIFITMILVGVFLSVYFIFIGAHEVERVFLYSLPLGFSLGCILFGTYSKKGLGIGILIPYVLLIASFMSKSRPDYPLLAIGWIILGLLVPIFGLVGFFLGRKFDRRFGASKKMKHFVSIAGFLFGLVVILTGAANAATITVCASGCDYTSIQAAVDAASNGDTINVGSGTYTENVDVDKSVNLIGAGAENTIVGAGSCGLNVTADYVNISGFTVTGATGVGDGGICLNGASFGNISNNNVSGNNVGIYLVSSSNNIISNNTANSNDPWGIYLYKSSNNTLTDNNANSNDIWGIYLYASNNNTLTDNTASNNKYGIVLSSSNSNTLTDNTMSGNTYNFNVGGYSLVSRFVQNIDITNTVDGKPIYYLVGATDVVVDASTGAGYVGVVNGINVTVKDLTLIKNGQGVLFANTSNSSIENVNASNNNDGIYLTIYSNYNTLTDNTANSNNDNGIYLTTWSNYNTLTDNTANSNNYNGIYLGSPIYYNTIANNSASNNDNGIRLFSSNNNTLTDNNASSNTWYGIYLEFARNNNITANHASNNGIGIWLHSSSNYNALTDNNANSNSNFGIYLTSSSNYNTLTDNNANSNNIRGIEIFSSSNNTIYNNYFNNNNNFGFGGTIYNNTWNTSKTPDTNIIGGSYLGGNFWAKPDGTGFSETCTDADGDGICDSNYTLASGNVDYLPLTVFISSTTTTTTTPTTTTTSTTSSTTTTTVPVSEQPQLKAPWEGTAQITQGNNGSSHKDYGTWDNTYAIDVALPVGTDVFAPADGVVVYVDPDPSGAGGKELAINHTGPTGKNITTVYLHLNESIVEEGDVVKQGQVVARSGNTGDVTGPHLHFHIWSSSGSYDSHTIPIERLVMKQVDVDNEFREYDARNGELDDSKIAGKYFESNNNQPLIANAGEDETVSSGDLITFNGSNSSDPDGQIVSYIWDFGDGETAEDKIVSHRFRGAQNESKDYTVTLTVTDNDGDTDIDTVDVTVYPLIRTIEILSSLAEYYPLPLPPIMTVIVYYNWVTEIEEQDTYIISKIYLNAMELGVTVYVFDIEDDGQEVWNKKHMNLGFGGQEEITFVYPFNVPRDWTLTINDEHFEGLAVGPNSNLFFAAMGIELTPKPSGFYVSEIIELGPGRQIEIPSIYPVAKIPKSFQATLSSPGELRVYDSQGRVTGLVDGEVKEEIPYSVYENETESVIVLFPTDSYRYGVLGTDNGTYGLSIASTDNGIYTTFTTLDVPTSINATHQYTVDWTALSQGEEGVTLHIDSTGDGIYEQNTTPSYAVSTTIDPANNMTSTLITAPANRTISISASNLDTFIYLITNASVKNGAVNIKGYSNSPVKELVNNVGLYLEINSSNVSMESASIMTYYKEETVNASFLNESTLSFYYWNESSSQWEILNSTVNIRENYVLANVSHFSYYALGVPQLPAWVNLSDGWNMFGVPVGIANYSLPTALSSISGSYDWVFYFNASTDAWQYYNPSMPQFSDLKRLEPGRGYFIQMTDNSTLNFTGTLLTGLTVPLQTDWNMFAPPLGMTNYTLPTALSSIDGGYDWVFYFNATTDNWQYYNPSMPQFSDLKTLEAGRGYFIQMTQNDTWSW